MQVWLDLARLNAPYLMLIAPLLAAALAGLAPGARSAWAIACVGALMAALIGGDLAYRVLCLDAPPNFAQIGVALHFDGVGAMAAPIIALSGALAVIAGGALCRSEFNPRAAPIAMALALCMIAGWIGAALAADFVALFVAAETAWLASVALVALTGERDRGALSAALRMLSAGGVASALMLFGVALIFRGAGGMGIAPLAVAQLQSPDLVAAGLGLALAALALKAGVAPLHAWVGGAYGRSGNFAAIALGAIGSIGALAAVLRVAAAGLAAPAIGQGISAALVAIGIASVLIGSVQAVGARSLRRLAAYAGAAQAGCLLVSVALGSPAGFAASLVQLGAQAAAALALLVGAASLGGTASLTALDGLSRRAPLASAALTAGALSLMGAPLTLGFLGRWRLIEAGVGGGWWWAAGAVIVTSLAGVFYGGRLIERIYFRHATKAYEGARDPWRLALAPALIAAIAATAIGLEPSSLLRAADVAAHLLIGEAQ